MTEIVELIKNFAVILIVFIGDICFGIFIIFMPERCSTPTIVHILIISKCACNVSVKPT